MAVAAPPAPAALSLRAVVKSFGGHRVLDGVDLELGARARVGLVGANGSGKSTILRLVSGADTPDGGALTLRKGAVVAHLPQLVEGDDRSVRATILAARPDLAELEAGLRAVEARLADPALAGDLGRMARVLEHQARLLDRRRALGADRVQGDALRHLRDLGLDEADLDRPTAQLSGGQRKLVALAACLVREPDVLLLDEPEAHLDVRRRRILEELVRDFPGAVLMVSHDRFLLDETVTEIAELEGGRIRVWPGTYSAYAVARELELVRRQQQWVTQRKEIARGRAIAIAVWLRSDGSNWRAQAAFRPAGGGFAPAQTISEAGQDASVPQVAFDGQGNAIALWRRLDGANYRVEAAGYDAAAPVLRDAAFPAAGSVGVPLAFGVNAVDVWSPVSTVWDFGDGATAVGSQVGHAYGSPGSFGARVTATDALGNATSRTQTVAVTPAPPAVVTPAPAAQPDRVAPVLSALRLSAARFRAAARGARIAVVTGTTIRYRLSELARVRFTVARASAGRRVGRSCRRPTAQNRRRAACTRYVAVRGSFTHSGRQGANRLRFRGRLGTRRLSAGRYRLLARATDSAGNRSPQRGADFQIVRSRNG